MPCDGVGSLRLLRRGRTDLQQSMRFVQMLKTAKVHPRPMIAGDFEISKRSGPSEPYLTESEVRLRPPKVNRDSINRASHVSQRARNAPDPGIWEIEVVENIDKD